MGILDLIRETGAHPSEITIPYKAYEKLLELAEIGRQAKLDQEQKSISTEAPTPSPEPAKPKIEESVEEPNVSGSSVVVISGSGGNNNPTDLPIFVPRSKNNDRYTQSYIRKNFTEVIVSHNEVLDFIQSYPGIGLGKLKTLCEAKYGVKPSAMNLSNSIALWIDAKAIEGQGEGGRGKLKIYMPATEKKEIAQAKPHHSPSPGTEALMKKAQQSNVNVVTDDVRADFVKTHGFKNLTECIAACGGTWPFEKKFNEWLQGKEVEF